MMQRGLEGAAERFADLIAAADQALMMLGAGGKEPQLRLVPFAGPQKSASWNFLRYSDEDSAWRASR